MSNNKNCKIRKLNSSEVQSIAINWAAEEGWNPGLHDGDAFYKTDPTGFYGGFIDDEPISCISIVKYPENFAFLGFYIVKAEYRGQGYGLKTWNHAMSVVNGYNIGLDGVVESQDDYRKSGFKLAYRNIRFEGVSQKSDSKIDGIVPLNQLSFDKVFQYDSQLFPVPRRTFLRNWTVLNDSYGFAALIDDEISGYTVLRKCRQGFKFGPLFADNYEVAEKLFLTAQNQIPEESKIYLDVPEINKSGIKLTQKYEMEQVFETARMYTGEEPDVDLNRVYGVTTFELG